MFDKNETGQLIREWKNLPYFYYVNFAIYGSRWKRFVPRWGARSSKPVRGVRRPWWVRLTLFRQFSRSLPDRAYGYSFFEDDSVAISVVKFSVSSLAYKWQGF